MLDTTSLLGQLPALLPDRLIEVAEGLTGGPAALYVVDISGTSLRRLAGSAGLPSELPLINGIGPEIGADGFDEIRRRDGPRQQGGVDVGGGHRSLPRRAARLFQPGGMLRCDG